MYTEMENLLKKLYDMYYDLETQTSKPFTEKGLIKSKVISKVELEDFDELFDEGLIDVKDLSEVVEGPQEIEYVLSKEAIQYIQMK